MNIEYTWSFTGYMKMNDTWSFTGYMNMNDTCNFLKTCFLHQVEMIKIKMENDIIGDLGLTPFFSFHLRNRVS